MTTAEWGETRIVAGELAEAVAKLKAERAGGYLLAHGGARFARSLVSTGLIDEYRLLVHPAEAPVTRRRLVSHSPLTTPDHDTNFGVSQVTNPVAVEADPHDRTGHLTL